MNLSPSPGTAAAGHWRLGGDLPVSRIGYGAMRLCGQPGNFGPYAHWPEGERLLRHAVDLGVTLIDTAEAYGPGWNEQLIASSLYPYPPHVVIATKGGVTKRSPEQIFADGRPQTLRRSCEASLRRLKVERIDLYQWHKPDPEVRFEDSMGELAQLQKEGKIRHLGLSNVTIEQIEIAREIAPIVSVQNRFNQAEQGDRDVLDYCSVHGLAFLPYGPLGAHPLKAGAPLAAAGGPLKEVADRRGCTPAQAALAWLLRQSPNIVVIPGATSKTHLEENVNAGCVMLTDEDCELLEGAPV